MKVLRRSADRGRFDFGWLQTQHTFSFGEYQDPNHRGFRTLRVINEDTIAPGKGFGTHPHREMEILTYLISGSLAHKDSEGNEHILNEGEIQRMSAGTGIRHSEYNPSETESTHLLQIWIEPSDRTIGPSYEQRLFPKEQREGKLTLILSPSGEGGTLKVHQDAKVYAGQLKEGETVSHNFSENRFGWLQLVSGELALEGVEALSNGDGLAISEENQVDIRASRAAEFLLFDLR